MRYEIPKILEQFETETSCTVGELKALLPEVLFFDSFQNSDIIEVGEPVFPLYLRKCTVNGSTYSTVSFYNYFIDDKVDNNIMLATFRSPQYIKEANADGFYCQAKKRYTLYSDME